MTKHREGDVYAQYHIQVIPGGPAKFPEQDQFRQQQGKEQKEKITIIENTGNTKDQCIVGLGKAIQQKFDIA